MFARTKRLTLRPGWPEDAADVAHAIAHEDVAMKLSRVPWPYTEADALAWLTMERARDDVLCVILAHEQCAPRLVGMIGIHPGRGSDAHELGYWLTPGAWGRGYATEAGVAMLDIAHRALGLRRVAAGHFLDNPASGNVLRKLGFRSTGVVEKQFSRARGVEVDCAKLACDLDPEEPDRPMQIAA
jgi:RimJ/RimL family protein N-acetyltransferase